jgi:hypothetical protein
MPQRSDARKLPVSEAFSFGQPRACRKFQCIHFLATFPFDGQNA